MHIENFFATTFLWGFRIHGAFCSFQRLPLYNHKDSGYGISLYKFTIKHFICLCFICFVCLTQEYNFILALKAIISTSPLFQKVEKQITCRLSGAEEIFISSSISQWKLKVGLSFSKKKNYFICFNESPLKMMKNAFYFILKALFILKIFKFLSRLFGHAGKTAWLERYDWFKNLWCHSLVNKHLQYTYYPISHEVKATRQWNLVSL